MAGDVRLILRAGEEECEFEARANSAWAPGDTVVIRRSPLRLPGTFATHASAAAADIPRSLIEAARDADTRVTLDVEPVRGRACAVLFALDPSRTPGPRLAAELNAAELVVAEDEVAAQALGQRVNAGPILVTGRVLVVAAQDLPGISVARDLASVDVETIGLPPLLAAAAASPARGPLLVAAPDADPRGVLRDAPAEARVAMAVRGTELPDVLHMAAEARGSAHGVLVQPYAAPVRIGSAQQLRAKGMVYVCFDAVAGAEALDPRVRAAVDALVADGVPTKATAAALAALTGWERRRAYDAVLAWRAR